MYEDNLMAKKRSNLRISESKQVNNLTWKQFSNSSSVILSDTWTYKSELKKHTF